MKKIIFNFQNCYGIKNLSGSFDFSEGSTIAIYAPNGFLKTSFAKTLKDFMNDQKSKDFVYPERQTVREITNGDGEELDKNSIFVIESLDENFESNRMSSLLVNKELKTQYDDIHKKINELKKPLVTELGNLSGLKKEVEEELSEAFTHTKDSFFKSLDRVEKEVLDDKEPEFSDVLYSKIFNEKVLKFLGTKGIKEKISAYIEKYNELIGESSYFKRGIFNHNNASVIAKNLAENGFFKADHFVTLNDRNSEQNKIASQEELESLVEDEKKAILQNPELSKIFENIDKKLKANKDLRDFRCKPPKLCASQN